MRQFKDSEEQYNTVFDNAEDSMLMVDLERKVIAVNKKEEKVIGYFQDTLLGRKFSLILSMEDRETFNDLFESVLRGEKTPTAEVGVLSKGGNRLKMEVNLTSIKKGDEINCVQVHLRDITERKILEKEIALERNKLKTIIESMGDGLDIVDKDFRIQFMNKKFLKLFGREAIGRRCFEIYTGRDTPCDECPVVKGIGETGILEVNTLQNQTFLVTHSPVKNLDGTISILEIFKDITERKKLQKKVQESEEQYKTLFDHAEDSMLMVDLGGRIVAVNKRHEEVIGYSNDALLDRKFSLILSMEDRETFTDLFEKALKGEKPPVIEVGIFNQVGDLLTMEMNLTGIMKGERINFVQIHLRDITKRKELEQQLLRSERFTALNHFCSTLAHDLRNPIIGIKKRLEGLQGTIEVSRPEAIKRVLADIISGSELLMGMVNDVLDVYQNSYEDLPLIVTTFPIGEAIEEAVKLLHIDTEERRVRVNLHCEHKSIAVQGDKRRLQRVFINLLDNAIKYSPVDSKVDITLEPVVAEGIDCLSFKIEDEGPGIPPAELSKIFEPFYRRDGEKEDKRGTGLGLYFCKVVVEALEGKIWAENRKEKGAAFYIYIPLWMEREGAH